MAIPDSADIDNKSKLLRFWQSKFHFNDKLIKAFNSIKREDFVAKEYKDDAYIDKPLPLLRGKTISQPTTVMIMTSALDLSEGHNVFEVGSGSGYQAAIIGFIIGNSGKLTTTEVVPELVHFAKDNISKTGLKNVQVLEEDGSKGHLTEGPYDRIIITAACKEFPKPLLDQLKPNGMIVGPVGSKNEQEMVRGTKDKDGKLQLDFLGPYLFTPMYGKYGFIH